MEFGICQNGCIPGPSAHVPEHEHLMPMRDASYPILADKHNRKFAGPRRVEPGPLGRDASSTRPSGMARLQ